MEIVDGTKMMLEVGKHGVAWVQYQQQMSDEVAKHEVSTPPTT